MIKVQNQSFENASYYRSAYRYNSMSKLDTGKMHGARRVATFCVLTAILPTILIIIPLYLRHSLFADVIYQVAESDVFEIQKGISSIFCEGHELHMNSSFSAYQLNELPETNNNRKHIRLKKSMRLPDDTLEYWGFYLLNGATVMLKACSRFDGGRILVVRGERNLRTCGLLEHNQKKGLHLDKEHSQVQVTLETAAKETIVKKEHLEISTKDLNTAEEDLSEDDVENLKKIAEDFIEKRRSKNYTSPEQLVNPEGNHNKRHSKKLLQMLMEDSGQKERRNIKDNNEQKQKRSLDDETNIINQRWATIKQLEKDLIEEERRNKRETGHKLDGAIEHGGNAINYTEKVSEESSISSFENNLLTCYDGQILVTQAFPPSPLCSNVNYVDHGVRMKVSHEVTSDGYYYYIFYSDNDLVSNDIHTVFDIYKPTFQYANASSTKQCVNQTSCNFSVSFFSGETVIVEIPTRDGIEHEPDDITQLVSICKPRMMVYMIFPITILFLILGCAFL